MAEIMNSLLKRVACLKPWMIFLPMPLVFSERGESCLRYRHHLPSTEAWLFITQAESVERTSRLM